MKEEAGRGAAQDSSGDQLPTLEELRQRSSREVCLPRGLGEDWNFLEASLPPAPSICSVSAVCQVVCLVLGTLWPARRFAAWCGGDRPRAVTVQCVFSLRSGRPCLGGERTENHGYLSPATHSPGCFCLFSFLFSLWKHDIRVMHLSFQVMRLGLGMCSQPRRGSSLKKRNVW